MTGISTGPDSIYTLVTPALGGGGGRGRQVYVGLRPAYAT